MQSATNPIKIAYKIRKLEYFAKQILTSVKPMEVAILNI